MTDEIRNDVTENEDDRPRLTTATLAGAGGIFRNYREQQKKAYEPDVREPAAEVTEREVITRRDTSEVLSAWSENAATVFTPGGDRSSVTAPVPVRNAPRSEAPMGTAAVMAREKPSEAEEPAHGPLFPAEEAADFRARWDKIQVHFVDEPRHCVEQADSLVAETMQRLAQSFANEREGLERQWDGGSNVSTEELRLALRRYRTFFGRLMQV